MKKNILIIAFIFLIVQSIGICQVTKTGTTAAKFLSVGIGPRANAMGGAFSSVVNDASALYWNPAGTADLKQNEAMFTYTSLFKDLDMNLNYIAVVIPAEDIGSFGLSVSALDYGEMDVTTEYYPEGTGERFSAASYAFGLSYARNITEWCAAGMTVKYITEGIFNSKANGFAFDVGTVFKTPFYGIRFATIITNYGSKMQMTGEDLLIRYDADPNRQGNNETVDAYYKTGGPGHFKVQLQKKARYVTIEDCKACGDCGKVCAVKIPNDYEQGLVTRAAIFQLFAQAMPSAYGIDKKGTPPCRATCPIHVNAQGYIALISVGKFEQALALVRQKNPFPGITGRICTHPCESVCRRKDVERAVAIDGLKRFVSDYEKEDKTDLTLPEEHGKKVAIIGAGPAGLLAAFDLRKMGYRITILEALPVAGGMGRLARQIGDLPPAMQEAAKAALKMGDTLKVQEIILTGIEQKVAGAGEAIGETFTGQMNKLRTEYGNFQENVGTPILELFTGLLGPIKEAGFMIYSLGQTFGPLISSSADLVISLNAVNKALGPGGIIGALRTIQTIGAASFAPMLVQLGLVAIAVGAVLLVWDQWNKQIIETNKAGAEAVAGAKNKLLADLQASGKSPEEIAKEYRAAQQRIRDELDKTNPALRLLIFNQDELIGSDEALRQTLCAGIGRFSLVLPLV